MVFTYLILNVIFLICVVFMLVKYFKRPSRAWWVTLAIILLLTLVFDSLIVRAGIVGYDETKILGMFVGYAPIEDFFYALLAVIIVPILWKRFSPRRASGKDLSS